MTCQDTSPNKARARLRAHDAELLVEVLGSEFPNARSTFDADWLLARVTWQGAGGRLCAEGPLFMIEELAAWGHAAIAGDEAVAVTFVEPNVQYACVSAKGASDERIVRVGLLHEAKNGNSHLDTRLRVATGDLAAFGRDLVEMARVIASRRRRARSPQSRAANDTLTEASRWTR